MWLRSMETAPLSVRTVLEDPGPLLSELQAIRADAKRSNVKRTIAHRMVNVRNMR